jgi:transposase-like protein
LILLHTTAYNISCKTLHTWLYNYNKTITPTALTQQQEELSKLKKELSRAKMENEILKKAAIYFANQAQ